MHETNNVNPRADIICHALLLARDPRALAHILSAELGEDARQDAPVTA
jgi:hypothetical protein